MRLPAFVCLSVCLSVWLSVSNITQKTRAWIWMKCYMSTYVGTWTNWLTFEPDSDYSPSAETRLLSPISYALQRGILLRRENPTFRYWAPVAAAMRGFKTVLFSASRGNTFVGGTCAPPSVLLVALLVMTQRYVMPLAGGNDDTWEICSVFVRWVVTRCYVTYKICLWCQPTLLARCLDAVRSGASSQITGSLYTCGSDWDVKMIVIVTV